MVTEIMARENCGLLAVPRTAPVQLTRYVYTAHVLETPPHYTQHVREYLNESLPNRWLGHGGPVAWPPRSPSDLLKSFILSDSSPIFRGRLLYIVIPA